MDNTFKNKSLNNIHESIKKNVYEIQLLRRWIKGIAPEKYDKIMEDVKNDIRKKFDSKGD